MKTSSAIAALTIMLSVILTMIIAPTATPLVAAPPAVVTPGTEVPTPTATPTPTAEPTPEPVVNVAVDQQVSPTEALVGDLVKLYVRVFNPGDHPGNNLVVTIPVPSGLVLINVDASRGNVTILEGGRLVRVELGTLLPGLTDEITLVTRAVTAGVIEGNVQLTCSNATDLLIDNVDRVTLLVRAAPLTGTPSPTATEAAVSSATNAPQPAPTPVVALRLPNTGAPDRPNMIGLIALAIMLIVVGAVVRTRMVKH